MYDIDKIIKERGNNYGDYMGNVVVRSGIMRLVKDRYFEVHNSDIEPIEEAFIYDIVNKLARIAASPHHIDSWVDIIGYSKLVLKELEREA